MAKLPVDIPELVKQFGPTLNRVPAGGWVGSEKEDRMVKTHCCFCGQQCGIQLRVRNNKVVGWEPWEDFPFNLGKLCPKGVKRYMQDEHPDRLRVLQAVGVLVLHVALHALGTELSQVEGKVLPWLPSHYLVVTDTQLNATLLSAETAMGLHHPVFFFRTDPSARGDAIERGTELLYYC